MWILCATLQCRLNGWVHMFKAVGISLRAGNRQRQYCTISINLTLTCDCDTLDQFNTSTQTASDHDQVKISTLSKAWTGSFWCVLWWIGAAKGCKRQKMQKPTETAEIWAEFWNFSPFWPCHMLDLFDTGLGDVWQGPIFDRILGPVTCDSWIDRNGTVGCETLGEVQKHVL